MLLFAMLSGRLYFFPPFLRVDRSLMLWKLNFGRLASTVMELNMKNIRTVRSHVQYDSASLIRWSPDSKALLTVRTLGNNVEIYKVLKKPVAGGLPSVQSSHAFEKVIDVSLTLFILQLTFFFFYCG